jgi:hypothetical protein
MSVARAHFGALITIAMLAIAPPARAQATGTEVALAETLYRQARDLMAQGKYDEACPKLAESYRLDRATGTLLNLASCHERQGKVATAWSEYADAIVAARRDSRPDRVKFAEDRTRALEPQLPRLTLVVPTDADGPDLELRLDGLTIGTAARGVPTPLDPGKHAVEAHAPKKVTWSKDIDVKVGEQQTISIPKLLDAPGTDLVAKTADVPPPPGALAPREEAPPHDDMTTRAYVPPSVYVAGSLTLAFGMAAGITGGIYLEQRSQYRNGTTAHSEDAIMNLGYVNAGLFAATGVGAVMTAYFYFTRPDRKPTDGLTAGIRPYVAGRGVGLSLAGAF